MIHRSFDAGEINPILNSPEILPFIALPGMETLDVTELLKDPGNVLLMAEGGGIVFCHHDPGTYEVHTTFLPEHRGRNAIRASLEAYRWMFTRTDCMALLTRVPALNPAAEKFCKIVGATKEFERKAVWPTKDGPVDMSFWSLRYDDWVRKTPALIESGKQFHVRLLEEKARHGVSEEQHADEDCHDRYVGICAEMIYGGQPEKAVILYNRWSKFAGYAPISIVSLKPLMINIASAILHIEDRKFTVVKSCP